MALKQNRLKYLLIIFFAIPWPGAFMQYSRAEIFSEQPVIIDKNELKRRADKLDFSEKPGQSKNRKKENSTAQTPSYSKGSKGSSNSAYLMIIIICLLLAIAIAVLFYNSRINTGPNTIEDIIIDGKNAETSKNLQALNIESLINQALANRDFKVAIRLLYLGQLKLLMEKGWLKPAPHKTNGDYSMELKNTPFREYFVRNTSLFERVWYGEVAINRDIYDSAESNFLLLSNLLSKKTNG